MKAYNIKELLREDTVVNCKTKKQAINFLKYLHSQGYVWENGDRLLETLSNFYKYLNETCFELTSYKTVMYSPTLYYTDNGFKVLTLKDIKIKKEKKIMKRILHFKNPSLTKWEYEVILKTFVEITEEDFDQTEWQNVRVYMFMTDGLEVRLRLNILEELLEEFSAVTITDDYVYIKNEGVK